MEWVTICSSSHNHLIIRNCSDCGEVLAALDTGSMVHHGRGEFGHREVEDGVSTCVSSCHGSMVGSIV